MDWCPSLCLFVVGAISLLHPNGSGWFWHIGHLHQTLCCMEKGTKHTLNGIFLGGLVPNSGLRQKSPPHFDRRKCSQLNSVRPTTVASLSHWASTLAYNTTDVMRRVARVRLRRPRASCWWRGSVRCFARDVGRTARSAASTPSSRANRTSSHSCRRRSKSFRWRHAVLLTHHHHHHRVKIYSVPVARRAWVHFTAVRNSIRLNSEI